MVTTRIAILGSTGSIGTSALSVVDTHEGRLRIVALAAGNNVEAFAGQVRKYAPRAVALASEHGLRSLRSLVDVPPGAASGADGLIAVATHPDVDIVLCASSGTAALEAVLAGSDPGGRFFEPLVHVGERLLDFGPLPSERHDQFAPPKVE